MDNNVRLGEGVLVAAKAAVNSRIKELARTSVGVFFDFVEGKVKDLPETIKRLRNNPEAEQKIAALWSEHLFEADLAPKGYNGLPDSLLVSNLHQEGYLDGLYAGYVLAMMALADNDAPKDIILAARDCIRPNLTGRHYDYRDEFIGQYKDGKYNWIDKPEDLLSGT
jgi:hypothetical protein